MKLVNRIGGAILLVILINLGFSSIEVLIKDAVISLILGVLIEASFVGGLFSIAFSKSQNQKPSKLAITAFWFGAVANGVAFTMSPGLPFNLVRVFFGAGMVISCWFTEYLLSGAFGEAGGGAK